MLKIGKKSLPHSPGPQSLQDALPWTWHHCHAVQGHPCHQEPQQQPVEETLGNFMSFGTLLPPAQPQPTVLLFIPTCSTPSPARVS